MTIQVESVDSPSHVVVPVEGERPVSTDDVTAEVESNGEMDLAPSNPIPKPDHPTGPHQLNHLCHAPVPDDDPQYQVSSYNHTQALPESVGISCALLANK